MGDGVEERANAKTSKEQRHEIARRSDAGENMSALAREFGISVVRVRQMRQQFRRGKLP